MNTDILEGKWHEIKGNLKAKWGKLTDDDMMKIEGNHEELYGLLQKKYGMNKDEIEKQLEDIVKH